MITFPPQLREATPEKQAVMDEARRCMYRLKMELGQLSSLTKRFVYSNGMEIICRYCFGKEDVWVKLPVVEVAKIEVVEEETINGIIMHPRSGSIKMLPYTEYVSGPYGSFPETKYLPGVAGGWRDGKTELATEYIYPLVDEDNASFLISKEDDSEELLGEFLEGDGSYGNLYWWNGDEEESVFLSWKGTPTRHFRLPSNIQIPGFSIFETSSPGAFEDTPIYTAFGTKLYQDGAVLAEAPRWSWPYNPSGVGNRCLILGACQNKETGKIYIVCQADYYNAPENVFIFSDGKRLEGPTSLKEEYLAANPDVTLLFEKELTKIGIHTVLFSEGGPIDGWMLISSINTGRVGLPWFANQDGTEFLCSTGTLIDIGGVFTDLADITYGSYIETTPVINGIKADCSTQFKGVFTKETHFEFVENISTSNKINLDFNYNTTFVYTDLQYKDMGKNWPEVVAPDDPTLHITLQKTSSTTYLIIGGIAPFTTNIGSVSDRTLSIAGLCGTQDITVTDTCGTILTLYSQIMPLGFWTYYYVTCDPRGSWLCSYSTCTGRPFRTDCSVLYNNFSEWLVDISWDGDVGINVSGTCPGNCGGVGTEIYRKAYVCP